MIYNSNKSRYHCTGHQSEVPEGSFEGYTDSNFDAQFYEYPLPEPAVTDGSSTGEDGSVSSGEFEDALDTLEALFDGLDEEELSPPSVPSVPDGGQDASSEPMTEPNRVSGSDARNNNVNYIDMLQTQVESTNSLYSQLLSRGEIGNAHKNSTVVDTRVEPDYQHGYGTRRLEEPLEKILLVPKPSNSHLVGVQVYISSLRQLFMKNSRSGKFTQEHATLLSHLDSLFTPLQDSSCQDQQLDSLERARKILFEVGTILDNVLRRWRYTEGHHVRIEQFFLVKELDDTIVWTNSEEVPCLSSVIQMMRQRDLYEFASAVKKEFYEPVVQMLGPWKSGWRDMSVFSPEERTAATAFAEASLIFAESDNPLRHGSLSTVCRDVLPLGLAMQPPLDYRVYLPPERRELTGLSYGVHPRMIPTGTKRNSQGISANRTASGRRSASAAARLKGWVRLPHKCIEAEGKILHILQTFEPGDESGPQLAETEEGVDDSSRRGCYETPPLQGLGLLAFSERKRIYSDVTEVYNWLYNHEWMDIINKQIVKRSKREGWEDVRTINAGGIPSCQGDLDEDSYPNSTRGKDFAGPGRGPCPTATKDPVKDASECKNEMRVLGIFHYFRSSKHQLGGHYFLPMFPLKILKSETLGS